jgi:dephospho-CoA kinase
MMQCVRQVSKSHRKARQNSAKIFALKLTTVAVVAPRRLRHRRLAERPERPFNATEADQRDWTEIENLEKGGPIAIADHFIMNDKDLDNLHRQLNEVCEEIEFYS